MVGRSPEWCVRCPGSGSEWSSRSIWGTGVSCDGSIGASEKGDKSLIAWVTQQANSEPGVCALSDEVATELVEDQPIPTYTSPGLAVIARPEVMDGFPVDERSALPRGCSVPDDWHCENMQAVGPENTANFAKCLSRMRDVLDGVRCDDQIEARVRVRQRKEIFRPHGARCTAIFGVAQVR